ncbi:MAG: paraslipin [Leptospiraceae bacterium]|nr:paraslipin [Leptospiraceae bacterium]MCB1201192.1 paraslipin [Leptospiraceae bacterium]
MTIFSLVVWGALFAIFLFQLIRSIRIVPAQKAYIVERLGKYSKTLRAGFHLLFPFLDKVTYILDLREEAINVPPQDCFTSDNVKVEVDGVIYISIVNPEKASYGITNYRFGSIQLAQTTVRAVIGTLDLDKSFEERELINKRIVEVLSEAGESWGVRVHRYEVKNIVPPDTVRNAMERQMTAERERRAAIARSEGVRDSRINNSEGIKSELINKSEGEKQRRINQAEGRAQEIAALAEATAAAIETMGAALSQQGGPEAITLRLGEQYLQRLSGLAREDAHIILPADLTNSEKLLGVTRIADIGKKKP